MSNVPAKFISQAPALRMTFSMPSQQEMQSLIDFCKVMSTAPFYQKLGPGGIMAIYLTAKEYNLPFMACMNGGLHTFDGKVTFAAIMIDALILNAGHHTEVLHLDENSCKIKFVRGDRKNDKTYKPFEYEYTIQQAQKAGYLSKNNWKTSPKDMLYSRCITGGGRKHIPEVFVGVLVTGELVGDNSDGNIPPSTSYESSNENLPIQNESVENTSPPVEAPKAIEFVKAQGFDEFCLQHGLMGETKKAEYVIKLAEATNSSKEKIINHAVTHPDRFLTAFGNWEAENSKPVKPKKSKKEEASVEEQPLEIMHMDELVEAESM